MEPYDYQGMDVKAIEVFKGTRYQNLWWVKEAEKIKDFSIQFWIYWEALQAVAVKVPRLSKEFVEKYQMIARFTIGPHAIHVQAWQDVDKKWFPMRYKVSDAELEEIINDWSTEWREPISLVEVSMEPPADAPNDPMSKDDQQSHQEYDEESSIEKPTDPKA